MPVLVIGNVRNFQIIMQDGVMVRVYCVDWKHIFIIRSSHNLRLKMRCTVPRFLVIDITLNWCRKSKKVVPDTIRVRIMIFFGKLLNRQENHTEIMSRKCDSTLNVEPLQKQRIDGSLNGVYSVSPLQKVLFSKGNLQFKASNNSWHFAERQFDIIGEDNALISPRNDKYIDLFCWGASGYNSKLPFVGDAGDPFLYDCERKDITSTKYDWGLNNAIDNGGNKPGLWRTLTKDEWVYLLNGRSKAHVLHAFGKVAGICGLILMPDDYTDNDFTIESNDFDSNIFTEEQWSKVEAKGVVFLPCAGHRGSGTQLYHINISGRYWSTTFADSSMANCFCVENKYLNAASEEFREGGISVRLVTNI